MSTLIFIIAIGLCVGSFVTLASWRLPRKQGIVSGSSRCPSCGAALRAADLVPVLSWLWSRCKCRHCAVRVHWRYPAIELATAATFALVYLQYGLSPQAGVLWVLATLLLIMIVIDFEHYLIPDEIQLALLALGVAWRWAIHADWDDTLFGLLLGAGAGLALCYGYRWVRKKDGLGLGDVKFLGVAGLWLGAHPLVPFLFLSGLLGVGTALLWRLLSRGKLFPFGPALAVSLFVCVAFPEVPQLFWNLPRWIAQ